MHLMETRIVFLTQVAMSPLWFRSHSKQTLFVCVIVTEIGNLSPHSASQHFAISLQTGRPSRAVKDGMMK